MVAVAIAPAGVPPAYPRELARDVTLRDGRHVHVRPVVPEDGDAIRGELEHTDAETLRRRFLGGAPPLADVDRFVTVDYRRRLVLLAVSDEGTGAALAQYDPTSREGVAEAAIVVHPEWRHAGLGAALLAILARAAVQRGYHAFAATFLSDNNAVWELLRASGARFTSSTQQGVSEVVIELGETVASRPSRAVLPASRRQSGAERSFDRGEERDRGVAEAAQHSTCRQPAVDDRDSTRQPGQS